MKRYPAYKDSGIEWLGEIPEHWEIKQLKHLLKSINGAIRTGPFGSQIKNSDMVEDGIKVYNQRNVLDNDFNEGNSFISEKKSEELKAFEIFENDILLTSRGTIGKCAIFPKNARKGVLHPCLIRIQANLEVITNRFLTLYIGETNQFQENIHYNSNATTIDVIYGETLKTIKIPCPPIDEQGMIISFLNHKTHLIDTLIQKKQRQIDLLKEHRMTTINQAVTKGLYPDVKMKDSEIEWLGEIPEHWEVKKLKYLTSKIGSGVTPKGGAQVYQDDGIPLIRSQNIHFDCLKLDDVVFISEEIHNQMSRSKVLPGDVLINITGASIGRCNFIPDNFEEANVNQHVCITRPTDEIETEFLFDVLSSDMGQFQVFYVQVGTSREGLTFEHLKNFQIPLPPVKEQMEIIAFLKKKIGQIFKQISNLEKEIEYCQEYRTTLISNAVTGKFDVRDWGVET